MGRSSTTFWRDKLGLFAFGFETPRPTCPSLAAPLKGTNRKIVLVSGKPGWRLCRQYEKGAVEIYDGSLFQIWGMGAQKAYKVETGPVWRLNIEIFFCGGQ